MMRNFLFIVCFFWSGVVAIMAADTHYVSLAGTNNSPYLDWAGAATQIQWAVDNAVASDTVLVSNGTYNLTNQINILTNIIIRSLNGTNVTIINGNYPAYTNRCFYMSAGALDGFTISNGFFTGSGTNGGGGIYLTNAAVYNCFIYKNYCSNDNYKSGGGGIFVRGGGIISNCSIVNNIVFTNAAGQYSRYGGGICMWRGGLVIDSRIVGNAAYEGGGIYYYGTPGMVTNCILANNQARNGGGIYVDQNLSTWSVNNCVISNNVSLAGDPGGGLGGGVVLRAGWMRNSTIIGNVASNTVSPSGGGGVYFEYGGLLSNCQVIANNSAYTGGGVYINGAGAVVEVVNCIIAANMSRSWYGGGGVYVLYSGVLKNCLIYGNTNLYIGGGIFAGFSPPYCISFPYGMINCTIAGNQAATYGGGIYPQGTNHYIENCIIYSNVTTNDDYDEIYNNIAANTNNYWHTCVRPTPAAPDTTLAPNQGNITNNPSFVDPGNNNYRLSANSPCVNRGTNQTWMTNSYDLDGRTRIRYGTVDMGAYEIIYDGTVYILH